MTDTTYVLGNWKMNTSLDEAQALFGALPASSASVRVGVAVPFPWLVPLAHENSRRTAWLGAQDVSPEPSGAYTGDTAMSMLAPYCDFVLVGHSERRQYHPEAPDAMRRKVHAVAAADRTVVLCVGENQAERQAGEAVDVVRKHLRESLGNAPDGLVDHLLVAYEPVWAIGTGETATPADAEAMAGEIAGWLTGHLGRPAPVLYGGSVTPDNAAAIMAQPHVNGVLVGGASLDAGKFRAICEAATEPTPPTP